MDIEIASLLSETVCLWRRREEDDSFLDRCVTLIKEADSLLGSNIRDTFLTVTYDTILLFVETAITVSGLEHLSEKYVNLFFQRNASKG